MKFNYDLAIKLRDEVFDIQERHLLSSTEGSTYIDVADQLMTSYGEYFIRYKDINRFVKEFAVLKARQGKYILEQLRTLNIKLKELTNPENFYYIEKTHDEGNINSAGDNTNSNDTNSNIANYSYQTSESSSSSKGASLNRGANTRTSQENKGIESKGRKDVIPEFETPKLVGKKEFDPNKVLEDMKLDVKEAHYEIIPEEKVPVELGDEELFSNLSTTLSGLVNNAYSDSELENLNLNKQIDKSNSKSESFSNTDTTKDGKVTRFVENEASIRAITLKIPDLQTKFFSIFSILFELRI